LKAIKELLKVEKEWIPKERGYSLYLRPTMIATTVPNMSLAELLVGLTSCLLISRSLVSAPPRTLSSMSLPRPWVPTTLLASSPSRSWLMRLMFALGPVVLVASRLERPIIC